MKELQFKEKMQSCPFCAQEHPVRMPGMTKDVSGEVMVTKEAGFSFCNCKNIWFTDPRNVDKAIYDDNYIKKYEGSEKMFLSLWEEIIPKIEIIQGSKFIEIGPMNTCLYQSAKHEGYESIAIDINRQVCETFDNGFMLDLDHREDREIAFPENCGLIWCTHVLEHLNDPIAVMELFFRRLVDGGSVFIAMPDPYFIDWAKAYDWGHWWVREHKTLWDLETFITECEKIGFECVYKKRNGAGEFVCNNDFHVILRKAK